MRTTIEEVLDGVGGLGDFEPCAGFYPAMDMILILKEDSSYRSDWFGPGLSVLRAPDEERIIGFRIDGADFAVRTARQLFRLGLADAVPLRALTMLAALVSWSERASARRAGMLDLIDAFYADGTVRDLRPEQWSAVAAA